MAAPATHQVETAQQSKREIVICASLSLLAFLAYANTLFGSFDVYDDQFQIVENPYVHSFRYLREIFTTTVWSFQGAQGISNYYRPLMTFGYLLSYKIAGPVPFTFHLVNLVLHALVVLLVFYLLRRWTGEPAALIAAALFALHPIHTESVAWIAAVTDLELTVFYLLTFLLYLRLAESGKGFGARAAMCASYALALLSKEQAMTLPILVTVFEHFYQRDRATTSLSQKISRYAPLWAMAGAYITVRATLLGGIAGVVSRPELSWYETGLSAVSLTGEYLWKLLWPAHLSAFYVFHKSSHLADRHVLLGLAGIALCGMAFAVLWRRAHILSFALLWMFLTLGPVLNARWMAANVFAERYLYLPSIGFCWILGWAATALWSVKNVVPVRRMCRATSLLLVGIAIAYAAKTVTRNRDWRTETVLYRRTLSAQPDASLIRANLGVIYFDAGNMAGAEQEWLQALASGPGNKILAIVLDNLALLRQRQHRYPEALDYSWRALRIRPDFSAAHMHLAETLALMGRSGEADEQFRMATSVSPLSTSAHNSYGKFLLDLQRLDDARVQYEASATVDLTTDACDHLGDIYLASHDRTRAERSFRNALSVNPFDSHAHFGLAQILETTGRPGDALHEIEGGLAMEPGNPAANAARIRLRGNPRPSAQTFSTR